MLFHILLLLLFHGAEGTGGRKPDPPFYSNIPDKTLRLKYQQHESKFGVLLLGDGKDPAIFIWDPVTQHKFKLDCPNCKRQGSLKVHRWTQRLGQLIDQNCLLLIRGYQCQVTKNNEQLGCQKTFCAVMLLDKLPDRIRRRFPFVLTYHGAVHTQVIRFMMTSVAHGVPMQTVATQLEELYRGRHEEVRLDVEATPGVTLPYDKWAAPPGETQTPARSGLRAVVLRLCAWCALRDTPCIQYTRCVP